MKPCEHLRRAIPLSISADAHAIHDHLLLNHLGRCFECERERRAYEAHRTRLRRMMETTEAPAGMTEVWASVRRRLLH